MKSSWVRIAGIVLTIAGAGALYAGGVGESTAAAIVGGVFVLGGVIAAALKKKDEA